jgi:hypothetical protein
VSSLGPMRGPPRQLRQVPSDLAKEALGVQGFVIVEFLARVLFRASQEAIQRQRIDMKEEIARVRSSDGQEPIGAKARAP